jgi:predicted RNA binding protein YcfA (HicA-like mRNA interferase family)
MVGARIAEIMAIGAERADVTAEEVIRELKALGFSENAKHPGGARIAEIMAIGAERAEVTAEEVIRELKALGFSENAKHPGFYGEGM